MPDWKALVRERLDLTPCGSMLSNSETHKKAAKQNETWPPGIE